MQPPDRKLSALTTLEILVEGLADKAGSATITLNASDIDALTARLAHIRASMSPEVPRAPADAGHVSGVFDPIWLLHAPVAMTDKLLVVRHPGLGWLMFQLPAAEAVRLGHALLSGEPPRTATERPSTSTLH